MTDHLRLPHRFLSLTCLALLLCMHAIPGHAEIYKCTDTGGKLIFSDQPCPQNTRSEQIESVQDTEATPRRADKASTPSRDAPRGKATVVLKEGGRIILETKSMQSSRGLTWHLTNDLVLPNGIHIAYKNMKRIDVERGATRDKARVTISLRNGHQETATIDSPMLYISGDSTLGKFNKQLHEIKRIEFH